MSLQRWSLGSYTVKYNPNSDSRSLKTTADITATANGKLSNPNLFFDKDMDFTIDIYDKPTYLSGSATKIFSSGLYVSISEKSLTSELFGLRPLPSFIDKIDKTSGSVISSIPLSLSGTPACMAYLDNRISLLYTNGSSQSFLYVTDESGAQISKYTINDSDYSSALSMAWDGGSYVYVLCKYGKIFRTTIADGTNSLVYTSGDYTTNQSSNLSVYRGIHYYNGFFGLTINNTLTYFDSNFNRIFSTDIQANALVSSISGLSYGQNSTDFYVLTQTKLVKMFPNTCGVDIQSIKNIVANGALNLVDEKGVTIPIIILSMGIKRLRNKQDARYQIDISGKMM